MNLSRRVIFLMTRLPTLFLDFAGTLIQSAEELTYRRRSTMSAFFDFDQWLSDELKEQPTFVLGGEKFTCKSPANLSWKKYGGTIMALTSGILPEGKNQMEQTADFFQVVLVKEDRERFQELLDYEGDDGEPVASNSQIGQLLQWFLDVYSGSEAPKEKQSSPKQSASGTRSRANSKTASINPKT